MKKLILILSILFFSFTAYAADFGPVWENTILPHEGGYSRNIHDNGNWTGCKEGKGRMLGSKYGISACTYGETLLKQGIIIKRLKPEQARRLAEKRYWKDLNLDKMKSQGIAAELCDEAYNMGVNGGEKLLVKMWKQLEWERYGTPVPVPAKFTPETIAWINELTKQRPARVSFYKSIKMQRVGFYSDLVRKNPKKYSQFFQAWILRSCD